MKCRQLTLTEEIATTLLVGVLVAWLLIAGLAASGCSSQPPRVVDGYVAGQITIATPSGPAVIDLSTHVITAEGGSWAVTDYRVSAGATVEAAGIGHTIGVTVEPPGACTRVTYSGVAAVSADVPGTCQPAVDPTAQ